MKIVQINSTNYGSTGSIMLNIHYNLLKKNIASYIVWGRGKKSNGKYELFSNNKIGVYFHKIYTLITGKTGFASKMSTKKLIKKLDDIQPDVIHLHNIHGYYINIEILFNYIKKKNITTIWTLHDCWPLTGHCSHFDFIQCQKWKTCCLNCPILNEYPKSFVDNSTFCYKKKKDLFTGVKKLTIVTPSKWLQDIVKKSYLKNYNVRVINNGIDTNVFKQYNKKELLFRKKYHVENKKIILGVAGQFNRMKGYDDYIKLSSLLDNDFIIVLVGLSKKQIKLLPRNILGIEKTSNVRELVDIYNSADIFLNLTYQDTYPTVNLEALACGTPVLSYDTGGSIEFTDYIVNDRELYVIKKEDVHKDYSLLLNRIKQILSNNRFKLSNVSSMDKQEMIKNYISLYKEKIEWNGKNEKESNIIKHH